MNKIKDHITRWETSVEELMLEVLEPYAFPIALGVTAVHELYNRALIFGRHISLNVSTDETQITF